MSSDFHRRVRTLFVAACKAKKIKRVVLTVHQDASVRVNLVENLVEARQKVSRNSHVVYLSGFSWGKIRAQSWTRKIRSPTQSYPSCALSFGAMPPAAVLILLAAALRLLLRPSTKNEGKCSDFLRDP